MEARIKTITVQVTEESHSVIRDVARRFGMTYPAVVAAMSRLWNDVNEEQRSAAMGRPLVKGASE